jgi:UDP-N-acetylglucosamine 2-epimerase (non-hydrolysing)
VPLARVELPGSTANDDRRRSVLVVLGTRPEAIKLAPVIRRLQQSKSFKCRVCLTAQHRDMVAPILRLFNIDPNYDLNVMRRRQTLTSVTCDVLRRLEPVLRTDRPDIVLVQGDTTSTFAATLAAFYQGVPVAHAEAGLRTGDLSAPFPEEANRRLSGALASWHFAPTSLARDNLEREGVSRRAIAITGNTAIDAVNWVATRINRSAVRRTVLDGHFANWLPLTRRSGRRLLLVTSHRRESLGPPLEGICDAIRKLARRNDVEIVCPVHPNPIVRETVQERLGGCQNVQLIPPQDYESFVYLMLQSYLILTDSGGIQEEAPALRKPVLVLRDVTERPEAIAAGAAQLVGTRSSTIVPAAEALLDDAALYRSMRRASNLYGDGKACARIEVALERGDPGRPTATRALTLDELRASREGHDTASATRRLVRS